MGQSGPLTPPPINPVYFTYELITTPAAYCLSSPGRSYVEFSINEKPLKNPSNKKRQSRQSRKKKNWRVSVILSEWNKVVSCLPARCTD